MALLPGADDAVNLLAHSKIVSSSSGRGAFTCRRERMVVTEKQWEERMWKLLEGYDRFCTYGELEGYIIQAAIDEWDRTPILNWAQKDAIIRLTKEAYALASSCEDYENDVMGAFLQLGGPWG